MITEKDRYYLASAIKGIEAPVILTDSLLKEVDQAGQLEDSVRHLRGETVKRVIEKISNKPSWTSVVVGALAEEFPNYFQGGPSLERFVRASMKRDNGPMGEIKLFSVELDGETGTLVLTNQRGPVEIGFLPERVFGKVQGKYLVTDSGLRKPTVQDHLWENLDKDQQPLRQLLEKEGRVFEKFLSSTTEIIERANRQTPQAREFMEKYVERSKYLYETELKELERILTNLSSEPEDQKTP